MANSATPDMIDALFALSTTALPDVLVYDGPGISEDPGDYLMVGVNDPDLDDLHDAADASHKWSGLGNHARDQLGNVWLVAKSLNGDADQKAARDAVFSIMAAVEDLIRTDPTLGGVLPGPGWAQMSRERLQQGQTTDGALAVLAFQINFQTRL